MEAIEFGVTRVTTRGQDRSNSHVIREVFPYSLSEFP